MKTYYTASACLLTALTSCHPGSQPASIAEFAPTTNHALTAEYLNGMWSCRSEGVINEGATTMTTTASIKFSGNSYTVKNGATLEVVSNAAGMEGQMSAEMTETTSTWSSSPGQIDFVYKAPTFIRFSSTIENRQKADMMNAIDLLDGTVIKEIILSKSEDRFVTKSKEGAVSTYTRS